MKPTRQLLTGTVAIAVLAGIFFLYTRPDFLMQMSNQLWSCF